MIRALRIAFLCLFILSLAYCGALLKHSMVNGLGVFSRENAIGALPLFAVVAVLVTLAVIGVLKSKNDDGDD